MVALGRISITRMIDQDLTHQPGGDSQKMRSVAKAGEVTTHHARVDFMHQGGGLKGVVGSFAPQLGRSNAPQFSIDQREQVIERLSIAAGELLQQYGDSLRVRHRRCRFSA